VQNISFSTNQILSEAQNISYTTEKAFGELKNIGVSASLATMGSAETAKNSKIMVDLNRDRYGSLYTKYGERIPG
jgi:hypothetical protein